MEKEVLKLYINEMISIGYDINEIKKRLIDHGYTLELINKLLPQKNIKLINYINKNKELGFNNQEITHALLISGYNLPEINHTLRLSNKKLR